ncbi:MAG TPA: metallophosphoesterase family protein, partial [Chthoniobacteraceae bacterium]|nr:metallophosphoesterase family protein [Chthoniobacteraceae bacterium]
MDAQDVRSRVCLGDIVGYAAQPLECLEWVRALNCPVLKGNHDQGAA